MKSIGTILLLISGLTSFSQTDKVIGDYSLRLGTKENNVFEYDLTLAQDGTFTFHYHSKIKNGIPPEVDKYGKGKWELNKDIISFFCEKTVDFDQKNTMDFSNSKARFITKSPRDTSDRIIKTKLLFLESEISWMKKIELLKI